MASIIDPTPEQQAGYAAWVASRPANVRAIAERFKPWEMYRLKTTNHRVFVLSFGEPKDASQPVTLTVCVSADFNLVAFERNVFGISPDDLEPCELPAPNELTGALI